MNRRLRRAAAIGLAPIAALALAACGDDADAAIRDGVLTVTLSDFEFGELPDEVPAGTRLAIENESAGELHELVAVRLADDDERPVSEIIADVEQLFQSGPPAAVLLAAPGGDQIDAVGDGTLSEPGRYIVLCSIPTGVDPDLFLNAAADSGDGPPEVGATGAPHFEHGMYAELTVT
ncbi:MAG: hypothetical protein HKN41_05165 [Ilumatobacter sp.]|nr:hypothetical protein [Ilumatobacter sp.]